MLKRCAIGYDHLRGHVLKDPLYKAHLVSVIREPIHAGSALLTFYPNFNLSLEDPNLPTTLKVQIQLQGAEQTPHLRLQPSIIK